MSFIYHGPLAPDSPLFHGRAAELARLLYLCQGEVHSYAIVYGGRQNGKTSLLLRHAAQLPEQLHACVIDFQAIPGAQDSQAYAFLAQSVADSLPLAPVVPATLDSHRLIRYLCEVLDRSPIKLCLLLDELGALPPATRMSLANVLRAMFTGRTTRYRPLTRLHVVLTGSIELYDLAVTDVSTLHNICEEIYLADLDEANALKLVAEGLRYTGLAEGLIEQLGAAIYTYTGGHPYLTQRLGGYLLEALAQNEQLSTESVEQAVAQLLYDNSLLRYLRQAIKEHDLQHVMRVLLHDPVLFSRVDQEMVQLELLGLAKRSGDHWQIRNPLLARSLHEWIGPRTSTTAKNEERLHLEDVREDSQRRLHYLERQAAQLGVHTPPHIITEIEDTRSKIAVIDQQLGISSETIPE